MHSPPAWLPRHHASLRFAAFAWRSRARTHASRSVPQPLCSSSQRQMEPSAHRPLILGCLLATSSCLVEESYEGSLFHRNLCRDPQMSAATRLRRLSFSFGLWCIGRPRFAASFAGCLGFVRPRLHASGLLEQCSDHFAIMTFLAIHFIHSAVFGLSTTRVQISCIGEHGEIALCTQLHSRNQRL